MTEPASDRGPVVSPCDWCRKPYATHGADEHPLPKDHPDYDAFYDATDAELTSVLFDALSDSDEPARYTRRNP